MEEKVNDHQSYYPCKDKDFTRLHEWDINISLQNSAMIPTEKTERPTLLWKYKILLSNQAEHHKMRVSVKVLRGETVIHSGVVGFIVHYLLPQEAQKVDWLSPNCRFRHTRYLPYVSRITPLAYFSLWILGETHLFQYPTKWGWNENHIFVSRSVEEKALSSKTFLWAAVPPPELLCCACWLTHVVYWSLY